MFSNLTGWHFLVVLVVILLLFGATKLPALARSLGQSAKIFRNEIKADDDGSEKTVEGSETGSSTTSSSSSDKE